MTPKAKLYLSFLAIIVLAVAAGWIVDPKGGSINLAKLKLNYVQNFKVHLGLDLQGGSHLVYQADFKDVAQGDRADALNAVRDTIERRVNSFGVAEPLVEVSGTDRVIVELPGIKDINQAIAQIGQTPTLEFRTQNPNPPEATATASGTLTIDPLSQWSPPDLSGKQLQKATVDFQQGSAS